jgi:hypothetical protein
MDVDVPPSDYSWAAVNSPFKIKEVVDKRGEVTFHICNCRDAVLMTAGKRELAQFQIDLWNEEAAAYWMMAP